MLRFPRASYLRLVTVAGMAALLACDDDPAGPRVTQVGDPCPASPAAATAGFFGCMEIAGRVLDVDGDPVASPDVHIVLPGRSVLEERPVFTVAADSSGFFVARFVVGPMPGEPATRERLTIPVSVHYTRAYPIHYSFREPDDVVDLDATFTRPFATPLRYELTLRQTRHE